MLDYAPLRSFPIEKTLFKVAGREPAQGRMGPDGVVKRLDVGEKVGLGGPAGIKTAQVNQLAFQAAEKVFRHSIVVGVALAGHALPDAQGSQTLAEGRGGVLDAPVAVEDQSRGRALPADGHVQGVQGELGVDALRKGIPYNFLGAQVFDNGEIQPAFPGGDVGDVAHPGLVRAAESELALEQVWRDGAVVAGVGGGFVGPLSLGVDAGGLHQPVHPSSGTVKGGLEHVVQAVQPQGRVFLVQAHQFPEQGPIGRFPGAFPTPQPGVVPTPRDFQQLA